MKLLQVPDIPNYQVDVVNGVVYTMRYGRLREVKMRTKYKSFTIKVNGQTIGTTLYRMMYCAINHLDMLKIPSDICMGSGSTIVAAIRENRQYIGIEKDEKYFDIANKRIKNETSQLSLFK